MVRVFLPEMELVIEYFGSEKLKEVALTEVILSS